jgi:hypothetical protein
MAYAIRKTRRNHRGGIGIISFTMFEFLFILALVENSKKADYNLNALKFVVDHRTTPENAQTARAIVDGNIQVIDKCIKNGSFTEKRYKEILNDPELQGEYCQMVAALNAGLDDAFDLLYNDIKKTPDTFCGWLDFYNQYLEVSTNLDLVHRSRLYYQLESYNQEN